MRQILHRASRRAATALAFWSILAAATAAWGQDEPEAAAPPAPAETVVVEEAAVAVEAAPAEDAVKPWGEMSVDEKVEALSAAALKMDETGATTSSIYADMDTLWTCLAAFLVFWMQAGFAAVECGFTRAKNACNIIMKNLLDFAIGTVAFWAIGFGLMFGTAAGVGIIGTDNFFFETDGSFDWAFLIFQTVFAATAATIVSGAMAERTKFVSYLAYSAAITIVVYPIFGCWAWNSLFGGTDSKGWLEAKGFLDFAGSTVVHSMGGWAALAGAIILGPRIGKYANGKVHAIPGHNIPLAALGVFILWLGWFGFNPGSTTAVGGGSFAFIAVTTNMAAAGGCLGALALAWVWFGKPDPSFALNGTLAGLVAITAGCNVIPVPFALLTGLLAGGLVVASCVFFDRIRVDDPVGAVSVHGVCGAFGTLAVGLFGKDFGLVHGGGPEQLLTQAIGVGTAFAWSFSVSMVIFLVIKYTLGLRVSEEEELNGLDIIEHGMAAYPPQFIADPVFHSPGFAAPSAGMVPAASRPATAS